MNENNNKLKLVIARLALLAMVIFACTHTKDSEAIKFPKFNFLNISSKSNIFLKNDVIVSTTTDSETFPSDKTNENVLETNIENNENEKNQIAETFGPSINKKYVATDVANDVIISSDAHVATRSRIDKMMFVGDIYFSKKLKETYDKQGVDGIIDPNYRALFLVSDLNVGNLECAIIDEPENPVEKEYNLYTPEKYVKALKDIGFNLFTLANNHILDFGVPALTNTMNVLTKNMISFIGAGNNEDEAKKYFIKEIEGKKYAIFSASAVIPDESWKATKNSPGVNNGYNIATICRQMSEIRKDVDKIIVYMHWGDELEEHSNKDQQTCAHKLVDFGADLVVGSHPHVTQEIEYYKNTPIVYSLGNFIYGATKKDTMVLEAIFNYSMSPEGFLQLCVYPGISDYEGVSYYWKVEDTVRECKQLQDKCDTCYIGDNGFVFTVEAVNAALGIEEKEEENIATPSAIIWG